MRKRFMVRRDMECADPPRATNMNKVRCGLTQVNCALNQRPLTINSTQTPTRKSRAENVR